MMGFTFANQPGAVLTPDAAHPAPTYVDTQGVTHYDFLYNNQNDFNSWTLPAEVAQAGGLNPDTGLPYNRGNWSAFNGYTAKADELGRAEAARQAAAHKGGGLGLVATLALAAAAIYSGGAALGAWGAGAAEAGAGVALTATESAAAAAAAEDAAFVAWAGGDAATAASVASYSAAAAPSLWQSLSQGAKAVNSIVSPITSTMSIVNKMTGQKSTVPANSPVPAGWSQSSAGPLASQINYRYDPATGAMIMETPQGVPMKGATPQSTDVIQPAPTISPGLVLAGLAALVFVLVR